MLLSLHPIYDRFSYSYGRLTFTKASNRLGSSTSIANGVVTITVPTNTTDGDGVMNNAIALEFRNQFGVTISSVADHVMYCLPPNTMSGIAYA